MPSAHLNDGFIEHLRELFDEIRPTFGAVSVRRMFGGYGIFREGLMFALVSTDTLYLKVDEENKSHFSERGLVPFVYTKDDKPMSMSYYEAPGETLDNADDLQAWARLAFAAAQRAAAAKAASKTTKRR
jgi:DNA transformation protein